MKVHFPLELQYALKTLCRPVHVNWRRHLRVSHRIGVLETKTEQEAVQTLSVPDVRDSGLRWRSNILGDKHGIAVSKETVRKRMMRAKLWRGEILKIRQVHTWRGGAVFGNWCVGDQRAREFRLPPHQICS